MDLKQIWIIAGISLVIAVIVSLVIVSVTRDMLLSPSVSSPLQRTAGGERNIINAHRCDADGICEVNDLEANQIAIAEFRMPTNAIEGYVLTSDNSGTGTWQIASSDGSNYINVKSYGAVGDSVIDDTAAIQSAINAAQTGDVVFFPPGTYSVSSLSITTSGIGFIGSGLYQTIIQGNQQGGDIIVVGNGASEIRNLYLSGFRVSSSVSKTSGAALHLKKIVRSFLNHIIIDGQDGSGNLYDGIWFDGVDAVFFTDFEVRAQNRGLMINGYWPGPTADLFIRKAKIGGSDIGVVIGGEIGGVEIQEVDIISNRVGLVIDKSLAPTGKDNREIFIGEGTLIDSSSEDCVQVKDLYGDDWIQFSDVWIASCGGKGIAVENNVDGGIISINGGNIFNVPNSVGISIVGTSPSLGPRVNINGMVIRNTGGSGGVVLENVPEAIIVGNTIENQQGNCVRIQSGVVDLLVNSNMCKAWNMQGLSYPGIEVDGTTATWPKLISSNILSSPTYSPPAIACGTSYPNKIRVISNSVDGLSVTGNCLNELNG